MCIGRIVAFQATTMEGIGHCGSCQCLAALTPLRYSMKSMSARRHTQMLTFAVWHLTISTRVNAWPLSFINLPPTLALKEYESFSLISSVERFGASVFIVVGVVFLYLFLWYDW